MFNLPAPYSQEAEEAVIGAILINPKVFLNVASFLKGDDFFFLRHQYIWQALLRLNERQEPVDYLTLVQELKDQGKLEDIGGPAFLTQLINATPTAIHAEVYGRIVEKAATRRRLMIAADEIKQLATNEEMTIEAITSAAEVRLGNVTTPTTLRPVQHIHDALLDHASNLDARMAQSPGTLAGIPTGIRVVDQMLGGLRRRKVMVVAGQTHMGKTSLLLTIAHNAAPSARVAVFNVGDEDVETMTGRLLSMQTGMPSDKLMYEQLNPQELSRYGEAAGRMSKWNLHLRYKPGMTIDEIKTEVAALKNEGGLDLVIIDYVQRIGAAPEIEKQGPRYRINYVSDAIKKLAYMADVPILLGAQLKRKEEKPVESDIQESANIAQDAHIVCLLWRDGKFNSNAQYPDLEELIFTKNKVNGQVGTLRTRFDFTTTRFHDWPASLVTTKSKPGAPQQRDNDDEDAPRILHLQ